MGVPRMFVTVVSQRAIQPGEVLAIEIDNGNYRMYARPVMHGDGAIDTRPPMNESIPLNEQYPPKQVL